MDNRNNLRFPSSKTRRENGKYFEERTMSDEEHANLRKQLIASGVVKPNTGLPFRGLVGFEKIPDGFRDGVRQFREIQISIKELSEALTLRSNLIKADVIRPNYSISERLASRFGLSAGMSQTEQDTLLMNARNLTGEDMAKLYPKLDPKALADLVSAVAPRVKTFNAPTAGRA